MLHSTYTIIWLNTFKKLLLPNQHLLCTLIGVVFHFVVSTPMHSANIKKELHSDMNPSENRASVSLSPHLFN